MCFNWYPFLRRDATRREPTCPVIPVTNILSDIFASPCFFCKIFSDSIINGHAARCCNMTTPFNPKKYFRSAKGTTKPFFFSVQDNAKSDVAEPKDRAVAVAAGYPADDRSVNPTAAA